METPQKDLRFDEFLRLTSKIPDASFRIEMCSVRAEWTKEITEHFSISALRYIFRETKFHVKKFVADCLRDGATTARHAERALSLWLYYSPDERSELILIINTSTESDAEHRAAYVLTKCIGLRKWFGDQCSYHERAVLLAFLKQRNSIEHARSALRWDAEAGNPLTENERQILRVIGKCKKNKRKVGPY